MDVARDTPDPGGIVHLVDDPQGDSVTIWDGWFDEEAVVPRLVRIDGTGDELARVVLHMPGTGRGT